MPITITSEINPILHCVFGDNGLLQCRIGLISEVIVIGIVNPMPLFPSLFSQSYPLIFSQKVFALVVNTVTDLIQQLLLLLMGLWFMNFTIFPLKISM